MVTIVLADDHPLTRAGIVSLIADEDGLELLGEAVDGKGALEQVIKLSPDIALLDIDMPGLDGISVARRMKEAGLRTKAIMLTGLSDRPHLEAAMLAGARGFVVKTSAVEVLPEAIKAVVGGGIYFDPTIAGMADSQDRMIEQLSPREREVLLLSSRGLPVKEVASRLIITERTVQAHLSSVYAKFGGAKNKTEALIIALKNGVITIEELLAEDEDGDA